MALKFIPKLNKSAEDLLALQREVNIMRELRHENIIALYDWFETDTEVNGELGGRGWGVPVLELCAPTDVLVVSHHRCA